MASSRRSGSTKKELLKELKGGFSSLRLVGSVRIGDSTFPGPSTKEGKTWKSVNAQIPVEISDGNTIYPRVKGGYKTDRPIIYAFSEDRDMLKIPFEERFEKEWLDQVARNSKYIAAIVKDEKGKLIRKEFLSPIDFEKYLGENLANGTEVTVTCDVEYSEKDDEQYRNQEVRTIMLNEEYEKNGEVVPAKPHQAILSQTYLINEHSLKKQWKKDLEKEGETVINAYVPQYTSSLNIDGEFVELKKTIAYPSNFKLTINNDISEEVLEKRLKFYKGLFDVPKDTLREIQLVMKLNEGYKESTGEVEITEEMQELIDCGIMTEEEVKQDATIRGTRVREVIFVKPALVKKEGVANKVISKDDEKYDPIALVRPKLDAPDLLDDEDEIDLDEEFGNEKPKEEKKSEESKSNEDSNTYDDLDDLFDDDEMFG